MTRPETLADALRMIEAARTPADLFRDDGSRAYHRLARIAHPDAARPPLTRKDLTMGSGTWSTNVYDAAARYRTASGASAFAYSDGGATSVHEDLDPIGVTVRESRDSDDHPESLALAVLFDVTGSMGGVPRTLQAKLPGLLGLLMRKGYVEHPQILFGAVGDATCDRAPLQIGQFESDNRMADDLGRILLEGGGGGQLTESYELAPRRGRAALRPGGVRRRGRPRRHAPRRPVSARLPRVRHREADRSRRGPGGPGGAHRPAHGRPAALRPDGRGPGRRDRGGARRPGDAAVVRADGGGQDRTVPYGGRPLTSARVRGLCRLRALVLVGQIGGGRVSAQVETLAAGGVAPDPGRVRRGVAAAGHHGDQGAGRYDRHDHAAEPPRS